ncbi:MFS transporter [Cnuibacter physcomitrellae]|uniref:MFS transporter n=1 Tax=Cnuibacter physcomitrellae TaxID=1619308 RepID=UPI001994FC03|nr:MFS transporter [Cnuibacter physcomitrellae]GGI37300.1 MFS transporter [Cnuibacter physcomitrellae]
MTRIGASEPSAVPPPWRGFERGEREYRRIVVALFAAGFATFVQVFDAQAVLPSVRADFGVSTAQSALMVSATTIGLALSVLPWSWLADRIGRTTAMRLSLTVATALSLLVPAMPGYEEVLALRLLVGVALGAVPALAVAYLAEELHVSWVAVAAATYVSGNTIGGIVGRLVAGPLSETVGWRLGTLAVALIGVIAAVAFWVLVPPARGFSRQAAGAHPFVRRVLTQLGDPVMVTLYVLGFAIMGTFAAVYNYLGFHLIGPPFGVPEVLVSLLFVAYLAGTAASRMAGALVRRVGPLVPVLGGFGVMLAGLGLLAVPVLWVEIVGLVVFTVGTFTAHPVASGLSGQLARIGRAQSTALYQLAWLAGTAFFGWAIGLVFDADGWGIVLLVLAGVCVVSAPLAAVGLGVLLRRRSPVGGGEGSRDD